ncbi:MAG: hypothetical protein ACJ8FY_22990 [Gemmataceae bacterium]
MKPQTAVLTLALLVLASVSGAILIAESHSQDGRQKHAEEFQNLVGGLGFGPSVDLSGPAFVFDPRLVESSFPLESPFPLGHYLGRGQAMSIFYYPTPEVDTSDIRRVDRHASPP